jgi:hypothetical protein
MSAATEIFNQFLGARDTVVSRRDLSEVTRCMLATRPDERRLDPA